MNAAPARFPIWTLATLLPLTCLPVTAQTVASYEPAAGCYIGAYIELDPIARDDISVFEKLTGKKHASYFRYVGYGQPFPFAWATGLKAAGAMPHIAWEPNGGLKDVRDDAYLRGWAQACAHFGQPIFLRFASEMNGDWQAYSGDPDLYIQKWRLVYRIIHEAAPNVIMCWCPFATPKSTIPLYYPGDDFVDWVGVNVYSVVHHEGDPNKRAVDNADQHVAFIYNLYADRKPIAVCEYAATHYCEAAGKQTIEFAIEEMQRMYASLQSRYPRVRMINWFSVDTVGEKLAHNDYSVTTDERVLQAYRAAIAPDYFLGTVSQMQVQVVQVPERSVALPGSALAPGAAPVKPGPAVATSPTPAGPLTLPRPPATGGVPATPPQPPPTSLPLALTDSASPQPEAVAIIIRGGQPGALLGRVTVEAVLGAALEPDRVSFELDGRFQGLTTAPPYTFPLNADRLPPGEHRLRVIVRDGSGNVVAEVEAAVMVVKGGG